MKIELKPLSEQVVVVTGASSGIGLATAMGAAEAGAKVVLAARSEATLFTIAEELSALGCDVLAVTTDVSVREDVERLATTTLARFGRIDTWVNDAGVSIYGRLTEVPLADSRKLFDTNFWGVVHGCLTALPLLKRQGGALITLGSETSEAAIPLQGMYSASKHAVKGFVDALRLEVEEDEQAGVSITLVQPTAVNTPFPQNARNFLAAEPKLPDPMIDPTQVADAILDAATHHRRNVKVGANATINTWMQKLAPRLADKMAASYVDRQTYEEPPRDPSGTLEKPSESGHVYGSGGIEARE
jgi:short-subunit dehydrogenase